MCVKELEATFVWQNGIIYDHLVGWIGHAIAKKMGGHFGTGHEP